MTLADELERLGKRNALDPLAVRPTYRDGTPEVEGNIDGWMVVEVPPNDDMFSTGMSRVGADFVVALVNNLPAIIAALRAQEWQDIETAPRDGTRFLGMFQNAETYRVTWWSSRQAAQHGNGWVFSQNGLTTPTHWRPLPTPPAHDKGEPKP